LGQVFKESLDAGTKQLDAIRGIFEITFDAVGVVFERHQSTEPLVKIVM